ncbi:hypothetical protein J4208_00900 [Candidatus Woesearchaeota archaeon]|nr:hypothetical protein [Candidatus Woesearchaeota archaeon]
MKKYWFKTKTYGWGWYPATWQGWLVLGIYILFFASLIIKVNSHTMVLPLYLIAVFILTGILLVICYLTGEKPRWRWGK